VTRALEVLQVGKLYYPVIGGVEQVVRTIAEGLRDRVRMRVLVCNTSGRTERSIVGGVEVTRAGSLGLMGNMPLSWRFFGEYRRASASADIVHVHMPFPLADLACLMMRRRAKVVVWWHSEVVRQRVLGALYRPLIDRFLRRADRIVVATPNHVRYTALLAPHRDKCVVIPFGVDARKYALTEAVRSQSSAIRGAHGTPLVLFIGRLVYYKGVETLVRAMADVSGHLVIIGTGPLEARLREMARTLGIASKVSFVGAVKDEELPGYLHACDMFVLPSVARSEAFGLVQLEAMACGKPVVNTSLESGAPWVSVDRETGLTVPPGDSRALASALNTLLEDRALREAYGAAARARVEKVFSLEGMLDSVLRLYESVAASGEPA
jgi:rhamnosyl/mannosyltransferase